MKRMIIFSLLLSIFSFGSQMYAQNKKESVVKKSNSKIEVYYFHYTRRCITCNALESATKDALVSLYPAQSKKGQISFNSYNLDEKSSAAAAKKSKAEGQSLLIISGKKRIDLTDKAFMYAKSQPDKLKAELKKAIDPLF